MARLTRARLQARTRAAILTAAATEFTERGYADTTVDRIADRAELTRGAVYSNFPGKRALYLAVLLDSVHRAAAGTPVPRTTPETVEPAAKAFAAVWLERLPLAGDSTAAGRLRSWSPAGLFDDDAGRTTLGGLLRVESVLLAQALETRGPGAGHRLRLAELILTLLHGAGDLAAVAPGFGDPFEVANACGRLATADLVEEWDPPYLGFVAPALACDDPWSPPGPLVDVVTGQPAGFGGDGVVVVLGSARLGSVVEAVRSARPHDALTIAVTVTDPDVGALVRLRLADMGACLARVFEPVRLPSVRVVLDDDRELSTAAGVDRASVSDQTEAAILIRDGAVVARAEGRGAAHAAATAQLRTGSR
ncbi:TetR/AcrR family transcriptional regulator [Actinoplanes sp. NBRC 101535]|uniref:TetR/AcrR family transcriptional regulator n=1 Tax=Actinoplanes sp. NBRC 101535 TaxID=3032196 RepID=UPI0024A3FF54|nr:TetR/AcrR family transcriptional regulator [Actinoplanes sp. NBRC 101535]GLY00433.1 TetR family transcriptional regulator [Actinoplanes sp. NBRC 101535]